MNALAENVGAFSIWKRTLSLTTLLMIKKRSWSQPEADGPDVFTTYDLGVSAALMCLGYKLIRLDRDDPRKALFVFKREAEINTYANQYFSDQLKVKARSFFDSIKALKNKLYSE